MINFPFPIPRPSASLVGFLAVALLLSAFGGYQLSKLLSGVDETSSLRSVRLLEIEERLDDASIGLGRQIQEWKDMLLRAENQGLYAQHLQGFKEASIEVQYALASAKTSMQTIGMDTADIDRLTLEHKNLLAEYLAAYSRLRPSTPQSPGEVDKMIIGVDRNLQHSLATVKAGISEYAKQQMLRAPQTQGNRYLLMGLLGGVSLFFMALAGFVWSRCSGRR